MLAAFRFRNFRSFQGEAELTLIANRSDKSLTRSLINPSNTSRSSIRVLPAIAIYGANAAGKTNVLRSLAFVADAVERSHINWPPDRPVMTQTHRAPKSQDKPASFEAEFYLDGTRYRYGFSTTKTEFREEWLFAYPLGRQRTVFQRKGYDGERARVTAGPSFGKDQKYLDGIVQRVRRNSLFLSAAAQDNHDLSISVQKFFGKTSRLGLAAPDKLRHTLTSALCVDSDATRELLVGFLQVADPSISDIKITPVGTKWSDLPDDEKVSFFRLDERRFDIEFIIGRGADSFSIPFQAQSEGVKKLYAFMGDLISCLNTRTLIFVDEIESSMHPLLARMLIDLFQDPETNQYGSQMIFTTHDTNLLDQSLLRRDQIWFVEKDACCSHLYSLLDFSPRKDADLEQGYLRGRYGAIPAATTPAGWLRNAPADEADEEAGLE